MKRFLKTITGKISVIFLCMAVFLIVSIIVSSSFAGRTYMQRLIESEQKNLDLYVKSMDTSLNMFESSLFYLPYNNDGMIKLEQVENGMDVEDGEYWQAVRKVNNQFTSMTYIYSYLENLFAYYPSQDLFVNSKVNESMTKYIQNYINDYNQNSSLGSWNVADTSSGWYMYRVYNLRKAYIGAWISCDELLKQITPDSGKTSVSKDIYLVDASGKILTGECIGENVNLEDILSNKISKNNPYIISYLEEAKLYLVNEIDYSLLSFSGKLFTDNNYLLWILLINVFMILITMVCIILWVHKPVKYLTHSIEKISNGDTDSMNPGDNLSLEFIEICDKFNDMLEQLNKTKIQMYEQELEKNQTKLRYLSQQIRPHFMLNALNLIHNCSKRDGELTRKIIKILSAYYRYVVNVESNYVPIIEELKHIENYLALQNIRYEDVLEYSIECDPALSVVPIPPFLMESFVGNCLKYGADDEDKIKISVMIKQTGAFDLKIIIRDYGKGFSEETLEAIDAFVKEGEVWENLGVGIRNSIERIRLIYKEKADIHFYNDEGAVVEIIINLAKNSEEEYNG